MVVRVIKAQEQIPQQLCTPSEYCLELHAEMLMWRPPAVGEDFRYIRYDGSDPGTASFTTGTASFPGV